MIRRVLAGAALLALYSGAAQLDPLVARSRGRLNAPVTVYEMSDFQCPYCKAFALTTLPLLEREYVASGKVRFVFINLPLPSLHASATVAAEAVALAWRLGSGRLMNTKRTLPLATYSRSSNGSVVSANALQ